MAQITIIQGENAKVRLRVNDKVNGKPHSFGAFEGATAQFTSTTEGSPVSVTGANPETNVLEFELTTAQSDALQSGEGQDFEYRWEQDGKLYIERVNGQLDVLTQMF